MNKTISNLSEGVLKKNLEKESNSLCWTFFHQPKAPADLKKFSKKRISK